MKKKVTGKIITWVIAAAVMFAFPLTALAGEYQSGIDAMTYDQMEIPAYDGDITEVVNENEPSTDTTETKARTFTVKFLNYDGTVHDEQTVEYGKSAKKPDDPTKPDDRNNSYRFKGWMSDYSYVTRDMEIKPIFEPVYRSSN